MTARRDLVAVIAGASLAVAGAMAGVTVLATAATAATPSSPVQQLTNAYPLGPQRLCCTGHAGSTATTGRQPSTSPAPASPAGASRSSAPQQPGGTRKLVGHSASGGVPAAVMIGAGAALSLLLAGAVAVYRTVRRPARVAMPRALDYSPVGYPNRRRLYRHSSAAASVADEREYRRLDDDGDAEGAFNLGVVLHQRGDLAGAKAAYERAEQRGDADAAFNLGVLLYETGDREGAQACWRRSAQRGHARAAANLVFLSMRRGRWTADKGLSTGSFNLAVTLHHQGDAAGAIAAYQRAELRGDPDAAFNLGVLLYELRDLDGAEACWRRSIAHGHERAAANLDFLLQYRHQLEGAGLAGDRGEQ
jgi:Tetratricopeptide repeat